MRSPPTSLTHACGGVGVDGSLVAVGRFTRPTAFSPVRSVLIPKRFCVR